jgi:predicted glycogen debranching enzyme
MALTSRAEWLEADGLGGFASGPVAGPRTRRYQALLLAAQKPPTGRVALVNGFDAWVETPNGSYPITSQRYDPSTVHPDGDRRLEGFEDDPWPRWTYLLEDGTRLVHELFVIKDAPVVALSWRLLTPGKSVVLAVRPFLSGRDYHALHHENPSFDFHAETAEGRVSWRPYGGLPGVAALTNGSYTHEPHWYRNFVYAEEQARGLDFKEDLAAPGVLRFDLSEGEAVLILAADGLASIPPAVSPSAHLAALRESEERRRQAFPSRLHRAADAYLVRRGEGRTIVAGYPWFADWGRDTFIALRGLCLAADRLEEARDILLEWAHAVSEGMLPNRFPDRPDEAPEFNSVDASLWYVVAVHAYAQADAAQGRGSTSAPCRTCGGDSAAACFREAVLAILDGYAKGTRHGIRMEDDGLLAAGEPGVQLTWMDAKVGDWVVTPRIGKPVEVQALWINALEIGCRLDTRWREPLARARASFAARFWDADRGFLADVVDVGHEAGAIDASFRPNQVFAIGGLPFALLDGEAAGRVVAAVEERLVTPLGLRSLAREDPAYRPRYEGGVTERDGSYHQGTVWPWLVGAFVEAWVRVRGGTGEARQEARRRFLEPLLRHMDEAGLGHVSEIADADAPHEPRGCPFQAWSVGEALRLEQWLRVEAPPARSGGSGPMTHGARRSLAEVRRARRSGGRRETFF